MTCWTQFWSKKDGAVAVEAALVLPFLLIAGFGALDASMLMLQNHRMETGLSIAGRYLAKAPTPTSHESAAKNLAATGDVSATSQRRIPNWAPSDVTISYRSVDNAGGASYRGGNNIRIAVISSEVTYAGFGFLKAVSGGAIKIKGRYEERLIAEQNG